MAGSARYFSRSSRLLVAGANTGRFHVLGASGTANNELDMPVEAARAAVMGAGAWTEQEGVHASGAGFQLAAQTPLSVVITRALASSRSGCCRILSWMFRKEGRRPRAAAENLDEGSEQLVSFGKGERARRLDQPLRARHVALLLALG